MDGVLLDTLSPANVPGVDTASHSGLTTNAAGTEADRASLTNNFLTFVYLLWKLDIPIINPCIVDAATATGSLGKGGQYKVDRVFENQRYPGQYGLRSENNLVYKRAITDVGGHGGLYHESLKLDSFVREIKALTHLRKHPNVVRLLGVAWENAAENGILPILVLEHAAQNSLANFLAASGTYPINFKLKRSVLVDVTCGLHAVHSSGIVWGDCKPENVLLFQDEKDPTHIRAKLSDFGSSVFSFTAETSFPGFSEPWIAPEARRVRGFQALKTAEIYSYGMLFWATIMDGHQFDKKNWPEINDIPSSPSHADNALVERLKGSGLLKNIAIKSVRRYLLRSEEHEDPIAPEEAIDIVAKVIKETLTSDADRRLGDIGQILALLSSHKPHIPSKRRTATFNGTFDLEYMSRTYGSDTRLSQVSALTYSRLLEFSHARDSPSGFYQASVWSSVGFGTEVDMNKSAALMQKSAMLGFRKAQGLYAKVCKLAQLSAMRSASSRFHSEPDDEDLIMLDNLDLDDFSSQTQGDLPSHDEKRWLAKAVEMGSRIAIEELKEQDPEAFQVASQTLQNQYEGVGASPRTRDISECIQSTDMNQWLRLNSRGDCLLHRVCLEGKKDYLNHALKLFHDRIDILNEDGESPFICAMRSGHHAIAYKMLQRGALPNIVDARGVSAAHWVISLSQDGRDSMRDFFRLAALNGKSKKCVEYSEHYGSGLEAGTPLDWAVDTRNLDAVKFLLDMKADPLVETSGRPSCFHRAAVRHDLHICELILDALKYVNPSLIVRLNSDGQSVLSYSFLHWHSFDQVLINGHSNEESGKLWHLLVPYYKDTKFVNDANENLIYNAVRRGSDIAVRAIITSVMTTPEIKITASTKSGPNRWSSLRRALYSESSSVFLTLCEQKLSKALELSPDGLTLLHECAFTPDSHGVLHAQTIYNQISKKSHRKIRDSRLKPRRGRGQLTPFQLAVLCQKFELADLLVSLGANPIAGVDKMRFLGFLIQYQKHDAYEISSFLSHIEEDPVVNSLRHFPHPASVSASIAYLLRNDEGWWNVKKPGLFQRYTYTNDDDSVEQDISHDPFLAFRPGLHAAVSAELGSSRDAERVNEFGMTGFLDSNSISFKHRERHIREYRSFLVSYNPDTQKHGLYGHKFITALEIAFEMTLYSPYPQQAEKTFLVLLDAFKGPLYCNYPYHNYSPFWRERWAHLRRRDTILHRAIVVGKRNLVQHLLNAGCDWEMANIHWQPPLYLAQLISEGLRPDLPSNHGSFLVRAGLTKPVVLPSLEEIDLLDDSKAMLKILERHAVISPSQRWTPLRSLREVRWPWDEYESDELGLRFLLYYFFLFVVVVLPISWVVRFIANFPRAFVAIIDAILPDDLINAILQLSQCVVDCHHNGSDPQLICRAADFLPMRAFGEAYSLDFIPAFFNFTGAMVDDIQKCYDERLPPDDESLVPGCPTDRWPSVWVEENLRVMVKAREGLVRNEARCGCTWKGKPFMKDFKKNPDGL